MIVLLVFLNLVCSGAIAGAIMELCGVLNCCTQESYDAIEETSFMEVIREKLGLPSETEASVLSFVDSIPASLSKK